MFVLHFFLASLKAGLASRPGVSFQELCPALVCSTPLMAALPWPQVMTEEHLDTFEILFESLSGRVATLTGRLPTLPVADVAEVEIEDELSERSSPPAPSEVSNQDWAPQLDGEGFSGAGIGTPSTLGDPVPNV